ncbi:hypothetical protein GIB67_008558 [Kingdonia uniflora]|uniref:Beta-carotene isomerase D27-like C-terminal domain-containing protein n=1 Tax=Kingdonia uniflora TaxID=39325 RepID=A0A7J7N3U7_9MAGN|nr:hypothetical protein GIB67_008558 [Kingdonia uniflora]
MEANLSLHHRIHASIRMHRNPTHIPKCSPKVLAVLTSPRDNTMRVTTETITTTYKDNWFDRLAINYLSESLQLTAGVKSTRSGYESLIDAASAVSQKFKTDKQQKIVVQTLQQAIPRPILLLASCLPFCFLIKTLLPQTRFTREYFAVFTTIFFSWLVGPCEVTELEIDGRTEKNAVHVTKCRFLAESNCAGMCINLCKMPSQKFIKDSLGMPFNMVPNFEDMSCKMIFGQEPPASSEDPAMKQPCYKILCKVKQKHTSDCSSESDVQSPTTSNL